jgi:hypothetical protein
MARAASDYVEGEVSEFIARELRELRELREWRMDVLKACSKARRWWSFAWMEDLLAVVERPIGGAK